MSELCAAEEPAEEEESEAADAETVDVAAHLADIEDGVGCTEIWEHLSDRRGEN